MNKREEEKLKKQQEKLQKELERTEAMSVYEKRIQRLYLYLWESMKSAGGPTLSGPVGRREAVILPKE